MIEIRQSNQNDLFCAAGVNNHKEPAVLSRSKIRLKNIDLSDRFMLIFTKKTKINHERFTKSFGSFLYPRRLLVLLSLSSASGLISKTWYDNFCFYFASYRSEAIKN